MGQHNTDGYKTFNAAAALGAHLRIIDNGSGSMALAGLSQKATATVEFPAFAANEEVTGRLNTAPGTRKMVASEAIVANTYVYAAASGKIAASGTIVEGIALQAASGDGSIIEVVPIPDGVVLGTVKAVAATGSAQGDAAALTGVVNVVSAGDDTKGVVLPTAAATSGIVFVLNSGSAGLKIYPAASDKINNGSANAAITILENTLAILVATAADNWAATFTANS